MRLFIDTGEMQWSDRKTRQVEIQLALLLRRNGCAQPKIMSTAPEGFAVAPAPQVMHLKCGTCKLDWFSEMMSACPACEKRTKVRRACRHRIPLPKGSLLNEPFFDEVDQEVA